MKALIIGRFQPLHNAHVRLMQEVDKLSLDEIVLGIGIEGKRRTQRNPFYYNEVKEMWLPALGDIETPAEIYPIPDINNPPYYAEHVENITGCTQKDTIVVSGNPDTLQCFRDYGKDYQTLIIAPLRQVGAHYLSATLIREWLVTDGAWQEYVPNSTRKVIEKIGIEKLKDVIKNSAIEFIQR